MKIQMIDVESAIPEGELLDEIYTTEKKEKLAKAIIDQHRETADKIANEYGGQLRTDVAPEFYIRRGSDVIEGGDFLLTASRWQVWVADNFDPARAAQASR